jgi:two-component sensor histidine kinase
MSKVALLENKINLADTYLDTAIIHGQQYGNDKTMAGLNLEKGRVYLEEKRSPKNSLLFINIALDFALKGNTPECQKACYELLAKAYSLQNNYSKAYHYSLKADSIKNVLYSNKVITSIKNIEITRLEKNSNEEIAILNAQNNLKSENIKNQKLINKIISLLAVLLSILLLGIVYILRQRNINNKELSDKNAIIEKALNTNKMLVKEIHHRVKNNLQIVSSLLGLQTRYAHDKKVEEALIESRVRIQAMSILHQNLYNKSDHTSISIKNYFEELCKNIYNTFQKENENIKITTHLEDIFLDFEQIITLGIVVNELITNAYKHAFRNKQEGTIHLSIYKHQNTVLVLYKDDGVGLPFDTWPDKPSSMGIQIIKSFLEKLEAEYHINNTNGCEIEIKFIEEKSKGKI